MEILIDKLQDKGVLRLLEEHLIDMHKASPPDSVHALDVESLRTPDITFWCARENGEPLGCIALKQLNSTEAEIKSMRTTESSRGKGVGAALLKHLIDEASNRGLDKLSLETGVQDFFEPARRLYAKFGFEACGPFADYTNDPNSCYMELITI